MEYNKLVRDKIPEIIIKNNQKPFTHVASDEEYLSKLKEKLREEVDEFLEVENIEEMADILEVIASINDSKNWNENKIVEIRVAKREKHGGFKNKIILERVE